MAEDAPRLLPMRSRVSSGFRPSRMFEQKAGRLKGNPGGPKMHPRGVRMPHDVLAKASRACPSTLFFPLILCHLGTDTLPRWPKTLSAGPHNVSKDL